jgi:hypothetical protein
MLWHVTTLWLNMWTYCFPTENILTENKGDAATDSLLSIKYCLFAATRSKDITSIPSALSRQSETTNISTTQKEKVYFCRIMASMLDLTFSRQ